mgnify:CR=1 FL=1
MERISILTGGDSAEYEISIQSANVVLRNLDSEKYLGTIIHVKNGKWTAIINNSHHKINKEDFSLKILPLICYEIIYSGQIFNNLDFDLIINISEDGWFGESVGPKQHFIHSIFRAVESGKYILRSANNGIAAIINPLGIVEQKVELGKSGYIDFNDAKKIQPTVFSKYGNKIFGLIILLYIFLIFSFNKIKNE